MDYRKITFGILLFLASHFASAQTMLSGDVKDQENKSSLPGASIVLENVKGGSEKIFSTTNNLGEFKIENVHQGDYYMKVSYVGYQTHESYITIKGKPAELGTVYLVPEQQQLNEVIVESTAPRMEMKGDTTVFNAEAYSTMPDANAEDLVKKLPGVVVIDGKVQAEGEDVRQVKVDGKTFFGEDPNIALRNLPVEIIDKIQIYDEKSEQARFTGFEDGDTKKTMNIVTRPGMKNSVFGKAYGGYGYENNNNYDEKYSLGGNVNIFNGDQRISVLAQTNNINQQNFSIEDIVGAVSGTSGNIRLMPPPGGMRNSSNNEGFRPPGFSSIDNFMVQDQGGISSTDALGINYSDSWGKKVDVTGSYFFNHSDNTTEESVHQEYQFATDSGFVYDEDQYTISENTNHRLNFRLDYDINDNNSLLVRPKLTFQENSSESSLTGGSYQNGALLNATNRDYISSLSGYNFSNQVLFRHKFAKTGRTLSLDLNMGKNKRTGDTELYSTNTSEEDNGNGNTTDQVSDSHSKEHTFSSNIAYTEPLSANSLIQINYFASIENNESEKNTFNYDPESEDYILRDTTLTNIFESKNLIHRAGAGYRFKTDKSNVVVGADYQISNLYNTTIFPEAHEQDYQFTNLLPNAMFHTRFSEKSDLMVMYRTSTSNPSVSQLQNVIDNSNSLQLSMGNPELEQQYYHRLMTRFGSIDRGNSTIFFAAFGGGITDNYISNSTFIAPGDTLIAGTIVLPAGGQLIKPVNLSGSWNLHSFVTYGLPVKPLSSNLNVNLSVNYSHIPALINTIKSYTDNTTLGAGFVLSSNIDKNLDFTLSANNSFSSAQNSQQENLNDKYFNFSGRFDLSWLFLKKLIFRTDLNYENYQGLSDSYNQQYALWNMSIGTKFMEENRGEVSIKVYDLLNQNNSIQRNVTATYIEDTQTNTLQRYFMLSFTYNFMKGGPADGPSEKRLHIMGPPDMRN